MHTIATKKQKLWEMHEPKQHLNPEVIDLPKSIHTTISMALVGSGSSPKGRSTLLDLILSMWAFKLMIAYGSDQIPLASQNVHEQGSEVAGWQHVLGSYYESKIMQITVLLCLIAIGGCICFSFLLPNLTWLDLLFLMGKKCPEQLLRVLICADSL